MHQKGLGYLLETINKEIGTQVKALEKLSEDVWIKKHFRTRLTLRSGGCVCQVTKDCSSFHVRENMCFLLQVKQTQSSCKFEEAEARPDATAVWSLRIPENTLGNLLVTCQLLLPEHLCSYSVCLTVR